MHYKNAVMNYCASCCDEPINLLFFLPSIFLKLEGVKANSLFWNYYTMTLYSLQSPFKTDYLFFNYFISWSKAVLKLDRLNKHCRAAFLNDKYIIYI